MDPEEVIADSEEEQEHPSREPIAAEHLLNTSTSGVNDGISFFTGVSSPRTSDNPSHNLSLSVATISSVGPLRNPPKPSIRHEAPTYSSVPSPASIRPRQTDTIPPLPIPSISNPIPQTTPSTTVPPKKERPKPRRKAKPPPEIVLASLAGTVPSPEASISKTGVANELSYADTRNSTPAPSLHPKRSHPVDEVIQILSSDEDLSDSAKQHRPTKKQRLLHPEELDSISEKVGLSPSNTLQLKKNISKTARIGTPDEDEDDPMLLVDSPPKKKPPTKASYPAILQYDDERFSDFNPDDSYAKVAKKKKLKGKNPEEKRQKKPKESKPDTSGSWTGLTSNKDAYPTAAYSCLGGPVAPTITDRPSELPSALTLPSNGAKRKSLGQPERREKKKKKRAILPSSDVDDTDTLNPIGDVIYVQRSSIRVAVAKSITSPGPDVVEEREGEDAGSPQWPMTETATTNKPRENKGKKKRKKKEKSSTELAEGDHDSPSSKAVEVQDKSSRPKTATVVEVVVPLLNKDVIKENVPMRKEVTQPAPQPTIPVDPQPACPVTPSRLPYTQQSQNKAPTRTIPSSRSQSQPHSSIPSYRRPNKPLTALLNRISTPGGTARPSGLSKFTRIAPLHANRKVAPPPPPPLPKKKGSRKKDGDEDSDGDWGESRGSRIKRLVREFEDLEGRDSKQANDRRKEIEGEIAAISGSY